MKSDASLEALEDIQEFVNAMDRGQRVPWKEMAGMRDRLEYGTYDRT